MLIWFQLKVFVCFSLGSSARWLQTPGLFEFWKAFIPTQNKTAARLFGTIWAFVEFLKSFSPESFRAFLGSPQAFKLRSPFLPDYSVIYFIGVNKKISNIYVRLLARFDEWRMAISSSTCLRNLFAPSSWKSGRGSSTLSSRYRTIRAKKRGEGYFIIHWALEDEQQFAIKIHSLFRWALFSSPRCYPWRICERAEIFAESFESFFREEKGKL